MTRSAIEITPSSPDWPQGLRHLSGAESLERLWWQGDPWREDVAAIAIVGSRQATAAGLAVAHELAREMAAHGIVVVSGHARGIDSAAHAGAVAAGGVTVAVCGCGLDIDYPRGQSRLREAILARGGAIVSEFPPGMEPAPHRFPQRNRIIAALAKLVVVVEAGERSGALSTARWARDLGRDVYAVPGPLHSPVSRGTNRLIRDGAGTYLDPRDILYALSFPVRDVAEPDEPGDGQETEPAPGSAEAIVRLATGRPVHPETIAAQLGLSPREAAVRIAELEIAGTLVAAGGGLVEAAVASAPSRRDAAS